MEGEPSEYEKFRARLARTPRDPVISYLAGGDSPEFADVEIPKRLRPAEFDNLWGRLQADSLPSDAWEKWCKDGVVCFSMGAMDLQKVYFANPRDLSIYHVADFVIGDKYKTRRFPHIHSVACVLLGSKIYMIGGRGFGRGDPTDVYYCDVATQTQLPDGGYEWMPGPDLKSIKRTPYVFSLAGNIYVLSVDNPSKPFEVLKANSSSWEVLPPPPSPLWTGSPEQYIRVRGSCSVDGKKILIQFDHREVEYLFMYDAEFDKWTKMEAPDSMSVSTFYCFHVEGTGFLVDDGQGLNFSPDFDFESLYSKAFGLDDWTDLLNDLSDPSQCHLLHLSGKKFCIIAFFSNYRGEPCYAGFATFDLDIPDHSDVKCLKTAAYSVSNPKMKRITLHHTAQDLLPYEFCSKM